MRLLSLAWRNIFRQKRRTMITLSALIIGLAGLVVFQGYISRLMIGFRDNTIRGGIGHLQLAASKEYFVNGEFSPFAYPFAKSADLSSRLSADSRILAAFPSTGFTAIAGFGEKSTTLLIKAYPAERVSFNLPNQPATTDSGKFNLGALVSVDSTNAPIQGASSRLVLGETAARVLKAHVGDTITLMAVLPDGGLNGGDFTVSGIYQAAGRDKIFAFTDFDSAKDFTSLATAPVLHVFLKDIADTQSVARDYASDSTVKTWPELATFYVQTNTMFSGFLSVIRLIILLITLFILANTMNRIVFERMREWGTLRALGTKKREILTLVVLEGALQGLVGSVLGILFGFTLALVINLSGGLPFPNGGQLVMVKVTPDDQAVWLNLIPVVIVAAIAAFFPALRAVKLTPSECLRQL